MSDDGVANDDDSTTYHGRRAPTRERQHSVYQHATMQVDSVRGEPSKRRRVEGGEVPEKPGEPRTDQERAGTAWMAPNCYQPAGNHGPADDKIGQPKHRLFPGESGSFSCDADRYRTEPQHEHERQTAGHNGLSRRFRQGGTK